jgi:hypothetical protein
MPISPQLLSLKLEQISLAVLAPCPPIQRKKTEGGIQKAQINKASFI